MRISDWSSDVCSSDLQTVVFFDLRVDIGHRATEVEAIDRPPYDGQLTALDGGLRHVVECEHGAERRLIEEAHQLLVAVVIVEASTGEQHRAVEQLLLETRFVGNDRFLNDRRSEEHTSELQSLMRISYAVFCLKKKKKQKTDTLTHK